MSQPVYRCMIKLGGSLLSWKHWPQALNKWLLAPTNESVGHQLAIIVGGGRSVDLLRSEQSASGLSDEAAHWLAVQAMDRNAKAVADRMGWPFVRSLSDVGPASTRFVLGTEVDLRSSPKLPKNWRFTSDSIAAWFAQQWQSKSNSTCKLVLLKSCESHSDDPDDWVANRLVDREFLNYARQLEVRWVNLRAHAPTSADSH